MNDSIKSTPARAFSIQEDDAKNSVHVVLDHRKEVLSGNDRGALFGETNTIWCSRKGIVELHQSREDDNSIVFQIRPTALFDDSRDYVVSHLQYNPDPRRQGGKPYEQFVLLVGKMPLWASFPQAWYDWVRDDEVRWSATEHIKLVVPEASLAIAHVLSQNGKQAIIAGWLEVAAICSASRNKRIERIDMLRNESWTSVMAMPMKLAKRLGGWASPAAEPRYEHPDRSGRVLVASADQLDSDMVAGTPAH